ncbi:uncharacterized protein HKW66_Vig0147960 [Vigna angularis]|uniref:Uncharacterized protein n=1 Tax=Phaseolus angularis TaxID=3914 RepID=A0A8T0JXT8_PHAAN|nr:uncharacterized protein HKW66_Vig0147960 [Vigna angularis]
MEVDASFTKCKQRDGSTDEGNNDDTNDATTTEVAAMNAGGDDPRQWSDKGTRSQEPRDMSESSRGRSERGGTTAAMEAGQERRGRHDEYGGEGASSGQCWRIVFA